MSHFEKNIINIVVCNLMIVTALIFFEHHKYLDFGVQSHCLRFRFCVLKKRRIDGTITKRLQAHNQVYYE